MATLFQPSAGSNSLRVRHFQLLRKVAQFLAAHLKRIPFPQDAAALGAKHQIHHLAAGMRSEAEIRWHLASRAHKDQRSVPRFHS
jgi:hypothetical protein